MTRILPNGDSGNEYLQFRGRQTSVTLDTSGLPKVHFGTERKNGQVVHRPLPVVDPGADDPPRGAIARPVAERIADASHLINWGVACEHTDDHGRVCGDVFDTPAGLATHVGRVHKDDEEDVEPIGPTDDEDDGGED